MTVFVSAGPVVCPRIGQKQWFSKFPKPSRPSFQKNVRSMNSGADFDIQRASFAFDGKFESRTDRSRSPRSGFHSILSRTEKALKGDSFQMSRMATTTTGCSTSSADNTKSAPVNFGSISGFECGTERVMKTSQDEHNEGSSCDRSLSLPLHIDGVVRQPFTVLEIHPRKVRTKVAKKMKKQRKTVTICKFSCCCFAGK